MRRRMITGLLAASLAFTPLAPAQAQMTNDEINRLLLGIATIGAVAVAVDKVKDRKDEKRKKEKEKKKAKKVLDKRDADFGRTPHRRLLPAHCVAYVEGRRGHPRRVLGKRCLEREMRAVHRLPQRCERNVFAFGRHRDVYGVRCLEEFGWTVARHR